MGTVVEILLLLLVVPVEAMIRPGVNADLVDEKPWTAEAPKAAAVKDAVKI